MTLVTSMTKNQQKISLERDCEIDTMAGDCEEDCWRENKENTAVDPNEP